MHICYKSYICSTLHFQSSPPTTYREKNFTETIMHPLLSLNCFFFFSLFLAVSNSYALRSLCSDDESNALLHFKQSFVINEEASGDPQAYPKVESWHHGKDCCSWDGVECDEYTGHVVGLDLHSSFLYGSIDSNSSLFKLVHLESLDLGDNHFNYSQIPSEMHHLSSLNYLNLSMSVFSGQIPLEISKLSNLTSLDLSFNAYYSGNDLVELKTTNLKRLVQNLTRLEILDLSYVNISSPVPHIFANLTSLRSLILVNCGLIGMFPPEIFLLPSLEVISLEDNENLNGHLPGFRPNSPLRIVQFAYCNFSGLIPSSLGSLNNLTSLSFAGNEFMGDNLTRGNLTWLGSLTKLKFLDLSGTNLGGEIPSSIKNLSKLQILRLEHNQLGGQIPVWLSNLTQLTFVTLQYNYLQGPIPESIFQLANLEYLYLNFNHHLNGTLKLNNFLNLTNLKTLDLTENSLSVITEGNQNGTLPKLKWLGLGACGLRAFPDFLQYQNDLEILELDGNFISGPIPEWIWNISTLGYIAISGNSLTGTLPSKMIYRLKNLKLVHLDGNKLEGPLPDPPPSLISYSLPQNLFSGEISPLICNAKSLQILKFSNNRLSGTIPHCLSNFSDSLRMLDLKGNLLQGSIPPTFLKGNDLRLIDLGGNQLEGTVPRSLVNCENLESLDLSGNHINDTFPFWLGSLPNLQVLGLRSNNFHGPIGRRPPTDSQFPMLRILDLSLNNFEGYIPDGYFHTWSSMISLEKGGKLIYMEFDSEFVLANYQFSFPFYFSIQLSKSGLNITYSYISEIVVAMDLSSNMFTGEIPDTIGSLQMLVSLNLSNNGFTGRIPSSLGNLTDLDSLDVSHNNLAGQIPPQLTQIPFLGFLNVSYNNLSGHIPTGKQFDTFQNDSYIGNSGLCGNPLSKTCGPPPPPPPSPPTTFEEDADSSSFFGYDKIVILMGYIGGLIVGVVIGQFFTDWKHEWFVKISGRRQQRRRRG